MNSRNFRDLVDLVSAKDFPSGEFGAKRDYTPLITIRCKVTPEKPTRYSDNINAFGQDRAITHKVTLRNSPEIHQADYVAWCGGGEVKRWLRIESRIETDDCRFLTLNCREESTASPSELSQPIGIDYAI